MQLVMLPRSHKALYHLTADRVLTLESHSKNTKQIPSHKKPHSIITRFLIHLCGLAVNVLDVVR